MVVDLKAIRGSLIAFLALHIAGGHVGIPLILLAIYSSRKITRHPVFVNFCITWMCFSAVYVLLLYTGQINNLSPSFPLCVSQAAMIYAAGAMIGVSGFVFVLHLFFVVRGAVYPNPSFKWNKLCLVAVLVAPYLVFIAVFTAGAIAGYNNPQLVHRSSFYCTIKIKAIANLGPGIAALCLLASGVGETLTIITLYRHWRVIRGAGEKGFLNLSLVIRATMFTVACILALLSCAAFMADFTGPIPNIILACLPVFAFLLFGTQADIVRVWLFWRKPDNAGSDPPYLSDVPSFNTRVTIV